MTKKLEISAAILTILALVLIPVSCCGQGETEPTPTPTATTPSPAESKILYLSDYVTEPRNLEIYVMEADGTDQTNITKNLASDYYPMWSPDGTKIAFTSYRNDEYGIWIMNADGSTPMKITTIFTDEDYPVWSPNGTKIAFTSYEDFTN
jgi:Tol biopolymer transport system component